VERKANNRLIGGTSCASLRTPLSQQQQQQVPAGRRSSALRASDASISLFQFRYDIDTIFTKYRDIDIDIDIKYVSKMRAFCRLKS